MNRTELTIALAIALFTALLLGWILHWLFTRLSQEPDTGQNHSELAEQLLAAQQARDNAFKEREAAISDLRGRLFEAENTRDTARRELARMKAAQAKPGSGTTGSA